MKVLLDTSALNITTTGVSNYVLELQRAFRHSNLPVSLIDHAYRPFFGRETPLRIIDSILRDTLWPSTRLVDKAKRIQADLIHCPAFKFPLFTQEKLLITVHDIYAMVKP